MDASDAVHAEAADAEDDQIGEEDDEQMADQGESANMTEATATGTPENELADEFASEKVKGQLDDSDSPKKRRGRPKRVAA